MPKFRADGGQRRSAAPERHSSTSKSRHCSTGRRPPASPSSASITGPARSGRALTGFLGVLATAFRRGTAVRRPGGLIAGAVLAGRLLWNVMATSIR